MVVTVLQILGAFYLIVNVATYISEDAHFSAKCFVGKKVGLDFIHFVLHFKVISLS